MAENVRVVVRCRPMNKREHELKCRNIVKIENYAVSVQNPSDLSAPAKTFTFDSVYDTLASTEALYNDVCYSLVDNVLEGYNGTIFAYGQTGCGKTHTMQGPNDDEGPVAQRGVITRSFDHIFEAISVASDVRYLALVSYLEIYNETIRDLLNPHEDTNANHALKEQPGVGVTVPTLTTHTVTSADECYALLSQGNRNRSVGATLMNATSSRSHCIFTICLEQLHNAAEARGEGSGSGSGGEDADVHVISGGIRRGKLNLVDLAGSERQNKTGAVGERLKEATKINLSLSALGNVISALVDGKTKHIPYRDSKLTRLLQDSLGGNTKTLMISCISPADNNYDETLSTLRYASRAKNIANKPKINEDPKDAKLREYQEEILKLKQLLNSSGINNNAPTMPLVNAVDLPASVPSADEMAAQQREWLEAERAKLKAEMEHELQQLKTEHSQQQHEKDKRLLEIEGLRQRYETRLKRLSAVNEAAATAPVLASADNDSGGAGARTAASKVQLQARERIEAIKRALIGGERANDTQLKERRQKKKLDAQRRLSALAHVLSRVEQNEDRDLLQGHYTNIQQELNAKNEYLKAYRQKVKALEREVSDLQAEFQLDRTDYLESIRRLERNLKFFQQLMDKALPILRKDGKYWDPIKILQRSSWNDDLKVWKLPETAMNSFKLPPATNVATTHAKSYFDNNLTKFVNSASPTGSTIIYNNNDNNSNNMNKQSNHDENSESDDQKEYGEDGKRQTANGADTGETNSNNDSYKFDILHNYFRSHRLKTTDALAQQRKEFTQRNKGLQRPHVLMENDAHDAGGADNLPVQNIAEHRQQQQQLSDLSDAVRTNLENRVLSSWLPPQAAHNNLAMNHTWAGYGSDRQSPLAANLQHNKKNALTIPALIKLTLEDVTPMNSGTDTILRISQPPTIQQDLQYPQPRPTVPAITLNSNPLLYSLPPTMAPLRLQSQRRRPHKVAAMAFTQTHFKYDNNNEMPKDHKGATTDN